MSESYGQEAHMSPRPADGRYWLRIPTPWSTFWPDHRVVSPGQPLPRRRNDGGKENGDA